MSDKQAEYIRRQQYRRAKAWRRANPDKVFTYRVTSAVNFLRRLGFTVIEPTQTINQRGGM